MGLADPILDQVVVRNRRLFVDFAKFKKYLVSHEFSSEVIEWKSHCTYFPKCFQNTSMYVDIIFGKSHVQK